MDKIDTVETGLFYLFLYRFIQQEKNDIMKKPKEININLEFLSQ